MRAWVLALGMGACGWSVDRAERRTAPPGVLWVTLEGTAPDAPGLDPLRRCGTSYTRAYLPTPQLQPNLATLFTGLPPASHGVWTDGHHRLDDTHLTVAEAASAEGWATTASTGTRRTDRSSGLHAGFVTSADQPDPAQAHHPADALVQRIEWSAGGELVWIHLRQADLPALPPLLAAFELAHPEGVVVAVGVEGRGEGLALTDADLHVPLVVCGPDHEPGATDDRVSGLSQVTGEVRLRLGLPLRGTLPLAAEGPEQVVHEARAGEAGLGAAAARGLTVPDGRLVMAGSEAPWYPWSGQGIVATGQPASRGADAHRRLEAAIAPAGASARRFPTPRELLGLAEESPWVLVNPDRPGGRQPPRRLERAGRALADGVEALTHRRLKAARDAAAEPGLAGSPASAWLQVLAAREEGDARLALAFLDQLPHGGGPYPGVLGAWLALEGWARGDAVARARRLVQAYPEHPELPAHAAAIAAIATLQPWGAGPDAASAQADRDAARRDAHTWQAHSPPGPWHDAVAVLLDPTQPDALDRADAARDARPLLHTTRLAWALSRWHHGRPEAARTALQALLRDDPTAAAPRVLLSRWDLELGHHDSAVRLLAPLARTRPDDPLLQAWFAEARAAHSPDERAQRQWDRAFRRP